MATNFILGDRAQALAHYPHARLIGRHLYLCGTSSRRPDNTHRGVDVQPDGTVALDIREQTEGVLDNLRAMLEAVGATLDHLADITTFLVNMDDFPGYNEVYNRTFDAETGPTRTTVAVAALPHPHLLIEMRAVAILPADHPALALENEA